MRTGRMMLALFGAMVLVIFTTPMLLAAPKAPPMTAPVHSDAWTDLNSNHTSTTHVTGRFAETTQDKWRGGFAEERAMANERALNAVASPRTPAWSAHSDDWDSVYFDRNVNKNFGSTVIDYQNPLTWQGCHAQADHKVQPTSQLVLAIH